MMNRFLNILKSPRSREETFEMFIDYYLKLVEKFYGYGHFMSGCLS